MQDPLSGGLPAARGEVTELTASPLDCPPWSALTTAHQAFAEGGELAVRYNTAVAPFGAVATVTEACFAALVPLVPTGGRVALQTFEPITPPAPFVVERQLPLFQMVLESPIQGRIDQGPDHVELDAGDVPDMVDLADRTRPGPFGPRTIELGRYIGIHSSGSLVAMAGERMRFGQFVEVSAVCVDTAFRGKGLAALLITRLSQALQEQKLTPFLHVFESNTAAIALYQKLGFTIRRRFYINSLRVGSAVPLARS
jgi:GNAT superfamily N-acetyltransferase